MAGDSAYRRTAGPRVAWPRRCCSPDVRDIADMFFATAVEPVAVGERRTTWGSVTPQPSRRASRSRRLETRHCEGIVLLGECVTRPAPRRPRGIECRSCLWQGRRCKVSRPSHDNRGGIASASTHIEGLGHTRFGFIGAFATEPRKGGRLIEHLTAIAWPLKTTAMRLTPRLRAMPSQLSRLPTHPPRSSRRRPVESANPCPPLGVAPRQLRSSFDDIIPLAPPPPPPPCDGQQPGVDARWRQTRCRPRTHVESTACCRDTALLRRQGRSTGRPRRGV